MATADFNLSDLFEKAFGYKTQAFQPVFNEESKGTARSFTPKFNKIATSVNLTAVAVNSGGRASAPLYAMGEDNIEHYLPVSITYPTYKSDKKDWSGTTVTIDLPFPVISISAKKKIIETELTEGDRGMFRELINQGDYDINIKGFCIDKINVFPEKILKTLFDLYECGAAVNITNALTDLFLIRPTRSGYDTMVIKEISFPEVRGVKNVWAYELVCVSDAPFTLDSI